MRVSNIIQIYNSGYFLAKGIVNYFEAKNTLKSLAVKWLKAVIDF